MSPEGLLLSVVSGYLSGLLFFYHLFVDVRRAVSHKRRELHFLRRFLPFAAFATFCAYHLKSDFILFPLGFYLSRLTASFVVFRMKNVWRLRRES
ncbi:N-ATPase subunit AtpR [Hydrogenivirga sp.]